MTKIMNKITCPVCGNDMMGAEFNYGDQVEVVERYHVLGHINFSRTKREGIFKLYCHRGCTVIYISSKHCDFIVDHSVDGSVRFFAEKKD